LSPSSEYGVDWYITNITATQFTINIPVSQPVDVDYKWIAKL
jgi:hypothetical protein